MSPATRVIAHRAGVVVAAFPSVHERGEHLAVSVDGETQCSCHAWRFRGTCSHARALSMLAAELGRGARDLAASVTLDGEPLRGDAPYHEDEASLVTMAPLLARLATRR